MEFFRQIGHAFRDGCVCLSEPSNCFHLELVKIKACWYMFEFKAFSHCFLANWWVSLNRKPRCWFSYRLQPQIPHLDPPINTDPQDAYIFYTGFTFPMFASQIEHLLQRSLLFAGRTTHHPAHSKLPRGDMVVRPRICCHVFGFSLELESI